jgi:serine protease Do
MLKSDSRFTKKMTMCGRRFGLIAMLCGALMLALPAEARGAPDSFADLSARLLPTVVGIATTQTMKGGKKSALPALPPNSPLQDLFRNYMGQGGPAHVTSVGSGFIVDAGGLIVTNNHVVTGAERIAVTLNNGEILNAKLIGRDEKTDLAVLKVFPKRPLPAARFGNSDAARVGEWVIAIGNPFGLGSTVTAGIISARNRDIEAGPYDDFIQTDAPINKGNSGGPLFDMQGNVIGINSAIFSPSGGSIGIGFAIPANMARDVVAQLRRFGSVRRGWVGMYVKQAGGGVTVTNIAPGGPADKSGLRKGDTVLGFAGKRIADTRELARLVAGTPVGKTVDLDLKRGGKRFGVKLTVALEPRGR